MTLIYLVRHGETDWNRERRIQGSTDIPLNDVGRMQAHRTGLLLAGREWHGIASSPLSRALETGEIIAREIGIDPTTVEVIDALVERGYGQAEGLNDEQLRAMFPDNARVPGRERREDVSARVIRALIAFSGQYPPHSRLLATTHGGVVRAVVNAVAPALRNLRGVPITNGSVHSFRHVEGGLELVAFNDPLDDESVTEDDDDFVDQNAAERRDTGT